MDGVSSSFAPDSTTSLLSRLCTEFGLSQTALGRLLGVSTNMMSQVMAGRRPLPLAAAEALARLTLAYKRVAAVPEAPAAAPDPAELLRYQRRCLAKAQTVALKLTSLRARAAWARRRLAALPALATTLPPGPAPRWLERFAAEAHDALAASSPGAEARLVLRQKALLYEAERAAELAEKNYIEKLTDKDPPDIFTPIHSSPNPLSIMAFSVHRFTTRAQCVAYLTIKQAERPGLVAQLATLQVRIDSWDSAGDPQVALAATQTKIAKLEPLVNALPDDPDQRRIENMLNRYRSQANTLTTRAENHGVEELIDYEQARDEAATDLTVLDNLLAAVVARHDELSA